MTISPSTTQRSGSSALERLDQLREVAGHRPLVAAADLDLVAVAEDDAPEAVPLRLVARRRPGSSGTDLASIGATGGITGSCMRAHWTQSDRAGRGRPTHGATPRPNRQGPGQPGSACGRHGLDRTSPAGPEHGCSAPRRRGPARCPARRARRPRLGRHRIARAREPPAAQVVAAAGSASWRRGKGRPAADPLRLGAGRAGCPAVDRAAARGAAAAGRRTQRGATRSSTSPRAPAPAGTPPPKSTGRAAHPERQRRPNPLRTR